jgi:hypothetical protein
MMDEEYSSIAEQLRNVEKLLKALSIFARKEITSYINSIL